MSLAKFCFWMKKFEFTDSVAVVTGAASGIGRELSLELSRRGVHVALSDIDLNKLAETEKLCKEANPKVRPSSHKCDVSKLEELEKLAKDVVAAHGKVNLLFNNAGIAWVGLFEECSKEEYDKVLDINLHAVINSTRIFLPILKKEKQAALINISSMLGYLAMQANSAYTTSKFAVKGFTEQLRAECQKYSPNVTVHVVHPGYIDTPLRTNMVVKDQSMMKVSREKIDAAFKYAAITSPKQLAYTVIEGVKYGQNRILVGPDAVYFDYVVRLMPSIYLNNTINMLVMMPYFMVGRPFVRLCQMVRVDPAKLIMIVQLALFAHKIKSYLKKY